MAKLLAFALIHGAELRVAPHDRLNPGFGFSASLRWHLDHLRDFCERADGSSPAHALEKLTSELEEKGLLK